VQCAVGGADQWRGGKAADLVAFDSIEAPHLGSEAKYPGQSFGRENRWSPFVRQSNNSEVAGSVNLVDFKLCLELGVVLVE